MCQPPNLEARAAEIKAQIPRAAEAEKQPPAPRAPAMTARETGVALCGTALLWAGIVTVPLVLKDRYASLWPESWYAYDADSRETPSPLGLSLGIVAVVVGQMFVLAYQYVRWAGSTKLGPLVLIQPNEDRQYDFSEGAVTHLSQPEGFVLIGGYLAVTWLLRLMPHSYYSFEGGVDWAKVLGCLMLQDCLQYGMHRVEHKASAAVYKASHKPHHRFTNPRLFDAFDGSLPDTLIMIVGPLYATANLIHCNVWTYMAFGSLYANWLCLIHSETHHLWDPVFALIKFGTAADHHVHHKLFTSNYGHLFMYWDVLCNTYKNPKNVRQFVPNGKPPRPFVPHGEAKPKKAE